VTAACGSACDLKKAFKYFRETITVHIESASFA